MFEENSGYGFRYCKFIPLNDTDYLNDIRSLDGVIDPFRYVY